MKKCPLCGSDLKFGGKNNREVFCSTTVECKDRPVYHYKFLPTEYAFIYPYRIIKFETNDGWELFILDKKISFIKWDHICDIPPFTLSSEESLLKRIKTIITFS